MSSIKIKGTASGTATFTIEPPSTNTNRTLNLPDSAGTLLDDTSSLNANKLIGTLPVMSGSNLTGIDSGVPSGTKMMFYQASAPTGWTKSTSHNDKALRVVSGSGGGSGGTHPLTSPPSTSHNHTTSAHNHGHNLSASAHTLSTSQMPSHTHDVQPKLGDNNGGPYPRTTGQNAGSYTYNTSATGGSGSHSHGLGGSVSSGGGVATGSSGPSQFVPQFIDVIVCSKD